MNHKVKNSRSPKEEKLEELLLFLHEIFPKQQTMNPFYKLNLNKYPSKYSHFHQLLTHFFTLIYQNNRALENQKFITHRDDVLASLQILETVSLEAYRNQNQILEACFEKLKNNTTPNQVLPRKFIEGIIEKQKSQTNKIIGEMVQRGYLELVGGYKNRGFLYKIIILNQDNKITDKVEKPTSKVDIFEGFDDFDNNENIDYNYKSDNYKKYTKG